MNRMTRFAAITTAALLTVSLGAGAADAKPKHPGKCKTISVTRVGDYYYPTPQGVPDGYELVPYQVTEKCRGHVRIRFEDRLLEDRFI